MKHYDRISLEIQNRLTENSL